jgi:hypothetical protein
MLITELQGNIIYPWKLTGHWDKKLFTYDFETDAELRYRVYFDVVPEESFTLVDVSFGQVVPGEVVFSPTGTGDAVAVFSTVIDICRDFLQNQFDADVLEFWGQDNSDDGNTSSSRTKLYANAAPRMARHLDRTALVKPTHNSVRIYLVKSHKELIEKVKHFFNIH